MLSMSNSSQLCETYNVCEMILAPSISKNNQHLRKTLIATSLLQDLSITISIKTQLDILISSDKNLSNT